MNLDPQSQAILDGITVKEVSALTQDDINFLRSRRSYLTSEEHNRYAEVLEVEKPQEPAAPTEEPKSEDEAPKKGKKAKSEDEA
jgi:hypothetical protein